MKRAIRRNPGSHKVVAVTLLGAILLYLVMFLAAFGVTCEPGSLWGYWNPSCPGDVDSLVWAAPGIYIAGIIGIPLLIRRILRDQSHAEAVAIAAGLVIPLLLLFALVMPLHIAFDSSSLTRSKVAAELVSVGFAMATAALLFLRLAMRR